MTTGSEEPRPAEATQKYADQEWELIPELQRSIVHLLLTDRDFFVQSMDLIKPNYFANKAHGDCYAAMVEHFKDRNTFITRAILEQKLLNTTGDDDVSSLMLQHELEMVYEKVEDAPREREYLLDMVVTFARKQAMRSAILESVDLLGKDRYDEIEEVVRKALCVGLSTDIGEMYFENVTERYAKKLDASAEGCDKFTCVFSTIDNDLLGGVARKELAVVFSNKSGVGKSIYLANVSKHNIFLGKKVLFLTLENSSDVTADRFDAMFAQVPTDRQVDEAQLVMAKVRALQAAYPQALIIKEFPNGTLSAAGIRAYIQKLDTMHGWRPDLVIVDYLDEMEPIKGLETHELHKRLCSQLRAIAMQENVCIFTATQSNREGGQKAVATDTEVGDSYAKVRVVDALWSINQNDDERARELARFYVAKHRNGRSRYLCHLKIDYSTMTMREITEAEYTMFMDQPIQQRAIPAQSFQQPGQAISQPGVSQLPITGDQPLIGASGLS